MNRVLRGVPILENLPDPLTVFAAAKFEGLTLPIALAYRFSESNVINRAH